MSDADKARCGDMGARVKPLVWQDFSDRGAKAQAWNEANYMIQRWSDKRWEISASYPGYSTFIEETDRFYPTLAVAKAAAQADYEARILAALEPAPDVAELVETTLDAAHAYLVEQYGSSPLSHPIDRSRILAKIKEQTK